MLDAHDLVLEKNLGSGTSSDVYIGKLKGQEVAVKVLKENIDAKLWEDFKKELKVMRLVSCSFYLVNIYSINHQLMFDIVQPRQGSANCWLLRCLHSPTVLHRAGVLFHGKFERCAFAP